MCDWSSDVSSSDLSVGSNVVGCHSEHASCFMELCRRHSACPEIIDQDLFYLKAGHRHDHQPTTRSPAHARNTPVFQQPDRLDQRTPSKTIATDQFRPIKIGRAHV